jgi:hypothetical protein
MELDERSNGSACAATGRADETRRPAMAKQR